MATEKEILKALSRLMDSFTIYNKDPEAIKAFTRIVVEKLSQFPAFIVDRAVEKIIETFTFMPKISEMLSACYAQRDEAMRPLNNRLQTFKDDYYSSNIIHPLQEWKKLHDDYLKLGATTSATNVMESQKQYCKKGVPMPEEVKKRIDGVLAKLEVK